MQDEYLCVSLLVSLWPKDCLLYVAPPIREISEHLRSGRAMKNVLNFPASGAPRNRDAWNTASSGAFHESFKKGGSFSALQNALMVSGSYFYGTYGPEPGVWGSYCRPPNPPPIPLPTPTTVRTLGLYIEAGPAPRD
jgi:hypothetical protein